MAEIKNIHQRLAEVRKACDYIKRDKQVGTGNNSYMAVTHDAVTREVRNWFVQEGISVVPYLVSERSVETGQKTQNGAMYVRHEVVYDVAFVNVDQPADREVVRVAAHGVDNLDKAPGKALSYAVKSAILKVLYIETGENDESRSIEAVAPEDIARYEEAMDEAPDKDALRAVMRQAMAEAQQCGDKWAFKRLKTHGEKVFAKRFNEFMPSSNDQPGNGAQDRAPTAPTDGASEAPSAPANSGEGGDPGQRAEPNKPAAAPQAPKKQDAPAGEVVTAGMAKTVRKTMERTGKDDAAFQEKWGFAPEQTPKAKVNEVLAWARG
jgi:hypothetical protein